MYCMTSSQYNLRFSQYTKLHRLELSLENNKVDEVKTFARIKTEGTNLEGKTVENIYWRTKNICLLRINPFFVTSHFNISNVWSAKIKIR